MSWLWLNGVLMGFAIAASLFRSESLCALQKLLETIVCHPKSSTIINKLIHEFDRLSD